MMSYVYDLMKTPFVLALIKIVILLVVAFTVIAYITLVERRLLGFSIKIGTKQGWTSWINPANRRWGKTFY